MPKDRGAGVSEAEIAVHWQEEDYYYPQEEFAAQADLSDESIFKRFSLDNVLEYFKEYADLLGWDRTWIVTLITSITPSGGGSSAERFQMRIE